MKKNKLRYYRYVGAIVLLLYNINCKAQNHSLGVNIASLAVGSINIELSKAFSQNITFHIPFSWNPIEFNNNKKIKHIMIQPGIRWWKWHSYSGYFGGVNLTAMQYNLGVKSYRYYGKGVGITLSTGYAKMISKKWNIEAEMGIYSGWVSYDKYKRELCGDYEGSCCKLKLIPAKLSLSL
ncbi:MAG: DUF3575 domain-containing protein, partial [Bacteroidales bacterium]